MTEGINIFSRHLLHHTTVLITILATKEGTAVPQTWLQQWRERTPKAKRDPPIQTLNSQWAGRSLDFAERVRKYSTLAVALATGY